MQSFYVELLHGLGAHRHAELREPTGKDQALFIDMAASPPVRCVSALIESLVLRIGDVAATPDQLARLTIGDRERLLLAVCSRLLGAETDLVVSCPSCQSAVEMPISFRDLVTARPASSDRRCALAAHDGTWTAELSPPTARKLESALGRGPEAARQLLEVCLTALFDAQGQDVGRAALPRECEAELAEKLLALDPLAECRIAVECPHCGTAFETLLDGFSLLKAAFGSAAALYGDVYRMARAYHWSEADILALPLVRRAQYLAIAAAGEAGG
ncbi:MAG: hypothetical protein ACOZAM_11290 [Pseudomonadota bacterium]